MQTGVAIKALINNKNVFEFVKENKATHPQQDFTLLQLRFMEAKKKKKVML